MSVSYRKFSSWNKVARLGEPEYYNKQHYTQGAKCWNGPHRSVEVSVIPKLYLSSTKPYFL